MNSNQQLQFGKTEVQTRRQDPIKICLRILAASWMTLSLFGCKPAEQVAESPAPKISGDQIIFPAGAAQLSYLTVEPATESQTAAVGLYGRLAWNDDVTVRVYSPVAGRVMKIPAEVNTPVSAGDALAELDSPDFGDHGRYHHK